MNRRILVAAGSLALAALAGVTAWRVNASEVRSTWKATRGMGGAPSWRALADCLRPSPAASRRCATFRQAASR